MFDAALVYFSGERYGKAERARTFFKKSEFLARMGDDDEAAEAAAEAEEWYYAARPEEVKRRGTTGPLALEDFDAIVMIMSR